MTKTYARVMKQSDFLSKEAQRLKRKEVDEVFARIKAAVAACGLSAAYLGLGVKRGPKPGTKRTTKALVKNIAVKAVVRFRDDSGNTWIGRGPRPQWLRDALSNGKSLGDFRSGKSGKTVRGQGAIDACA